MRVSMPMKMLLCAIAVFSAIGMPLASPATTAAQILERADQVMGFAQVGESVLHLRGYEADVQNYQSDRTYPPFFSAMKTKEEWFSPATGIDRANTLSTYPGTPAAAQATLCDAHRAYRVTDKDTTLLPATSLPSRWLTAWAVVRDWAADGTVRVARHEMYRDYERLVLARQTPYGEERLYLDPKTGFPVKLDLVEKHFLWGQRHIEYLYSNWIQSGGIMTPGTTFRLADGAIEISQTIGEAEVVQPEAAPAMAPPAETSKAPDSLPPFLQPIEPTIIPVGPKTFLLSNPGYTEAVTEAGDEVFLFDATQGQERAKLDAAAIDRLFPGHKKVTVVVTDLAWPHVAGVRYWVAMGATVVAHHGGRDFLQSIVERRWTAAPDLLEQSRKSVKLNFVGVDTATPLAGGAITVHPIDGIGSEVALMAYVAAERFLWASDYIQTVAEPSVYLSEVWRAAERDGLHPEHTAAEHLPLTAWARIEELQAQPAR